MRWKNPSLTSCPHKGYEREEVDQALESVSALARQDGIELDWDAA